MAVPPLHVRSHYSFLRGASSLDELIRRAGELKLRALALTDTENTCAAALFWEAARKAGITPLIGADVDGMTLLTRSAVGWENLCAILSRHHLGSDPEIGRHQDGLHFIVEDLAKARSLRGVVDRLWLELVRPARSATIERDAIESGLPLVASSDVHFARPENWAAHRVLSAVREITVLPQLGPTCDPGHHLRDLGALFADLPEALANNEKIAADCAWSFLPRKTVFPTYDLPNGELPRDRLRMLCLAGLLRRYTTPTLAAEERLERELRIIDQLGFSEYFLVVHDIVREARRTKAPIAGRGSGASSLVAYVLGLTNVCPLRYGLEFERFLHEGRVDWPDLDLDFCWRTRDSIIDFAFQRFGRERVAMVSSHLTFRARGAFHEAAKVHGLSEDQIRAVRRVLPPDAEETLDAEIPSRSPIDPARLKAILADARRIVGAPTHLSVHPGGVVITPGPIDRVTPVQRAEKGVVISQFDKDGVETIGLVKIDLLGNRAVSTIRETVDLVESLDGYRLDTEAIPDEDVATIAMLKSGRTIGVNQVESPAMRHLLQMMHPGGVGDVMKALALIRPGAAGEGMKDAFVRRHRGLEPWSLDARLRPVLGANFGVMLYEDDLMLVTSALTGMPLAEGDKFRRRIQKTFDPAERAALGREFGARCLAAGTPIEVARDAWRQMSKFTGYTFCMSHAASYAQLAYASAWLKAHHPVPFWVAALNNNQGMYEKRVYVEEARRGGVMTLLPCVNRSGSEFTADGNAIRIGLDLVEGLSQDAIFSILKERPFETLQDFVRRSAANVPECKALVQCGAFDLLGRPRPELLLELKATKGGTRGKRAPGALAIPKMPDVDERTKRRWEFGLLGMCPDEHLMTVLAPALDRTGLATAAGLPGLVGKKVRVAGILDALRVAETQKGSLLEFMTFEDETGVFEVTVWPSLYRAIAPRVRSHGPYIIEGVVEDHYDVIAVKAQRIDPVGVNLLPASSFHPA